MNKRIAIGRWQQLNWNHLLSGYSVASPSYQVRGRAAKWMSRYETSFNNMLQRARENGYTIQRTPGVRGGEWSAEYLLVQQ